MNFICRGNTLGNATRRMEEAEWIYVNGVGNYAGLGHREAEGGGDGGGKERQR